MKSAANILIRTGNGKRVDLDQCLLTDLHEKRCNILITTGNGKRVDIDLCLLTDLHEKCSQHLNQNWKGEKG